MKHRGIAQVLLVALAATFVTFSVGAGLVSAQRRLMHRTPTVAAKPTPEKPEEVVADKDYKPPKWCNEAEPNTDCLEASGGSGFVGNSVGYDVIKLANGKTREVIICDDRTHKPKPCYTPPPPHPETFVECMARRYRAYERTFSAVKCPNCTCGGYSYSDAEEQDFIRTMAAMDEKGKDECKGKPVD